DILVEACALREEISNFRGTGRFGGTRGLPTVAPVELQHSLKASHVTPATADQEQQRTPLVIASPDDCCEAPVSLHPAKNTGDFDVRRQAVAAQVASRSSAPINTPARASPLRAARHRPRLPAPPVTLPIAPNAAR